MHVIEAVPILPGHVFAGEFCRGMMRKGISSDSNSHTYMEKQMVKGSNEAMLINGENEKLQDKMCYGGGSTDVELLSSWPPRHYTCNFCKRRFKSAQALGGHMNIHRRARAMLRSQSVSPIPSPPSSPWLPNSFITSADHPFQHDEHPLNYPNPNTHWPLYTPHHTIKPRPSNLSRLPMLNLTPSCSLVTITHKNPILPAACNCKHVLEAHAQYHQAELITRERVKKNCIRAENQLSRTRVHQDDMISRLNLSTGLITSRAVAVEDIDLELRLGF